MSENQVTTVRKITLKRWQKEACDRFGHDTSKWAFKCPACGHIATVQDHIDAGGKPDYAYQCCIGRTNGKGVSGLKGKDGGKGCDWAAFGLFGTLGKGLIVIMSDGKEIPVFNFAPVGRDA